MPRPTFTRREALALIGASGAVVLTGAVPARAAATLAPPSCVARPPQTEGPFFVEEALNRSDIRSDAGSGAVKPGLPLQLAFRVSGMSATSCAPLAGAQVDVWHCDATGRYSDIAKGRAPSETFLRGYQRTDSAGIAQFTTIYPGSYGGRAVPVHFQIRTSAHSTPAHEFISQLYFHDALTERVYASAPYAAGRRRVTRNSDDLLFRDGGRQLVLELVPESTGYAATFDIGLQIA